MIRINLLPFRAARKRENIRRQVSIFGLLLILCVVVLVYYSISLFFKASSLKNQEASIRTELNGYNKELEEIKKLEVQIKEINKKLDVIKELEKGKTGPVLLLSAIADAVPVNKLWLTSLAENKGILKLTGNAMDNETVALFMNNLEKSGVITSVDLTGVSLKEIPQYKIKVSEFSLDCKTSAYKEEKKVGKNEKK
jgi:type IV pilus assembly protein PilN